MKSFSGILVVIIIAMALFPPVNKVGDFEQAGEELTYQLSGELNSGREDELLERISLLGSQANCVIAHMRSKTIIIACLSLILYLSVMCMVKQNSKWK
jgi:hypothetical protein